MKVHEVLDLLRWTHCTLCISNPNDKRLELYTPTRSYDELGVTYLRVLSDRVLNLDVDIVKPTTYGYANIYIKGFKKNV